MFEDEPFDYAFCGSMLMLSDPNVNPLYLADLFFGYFHSNCHDRANSYIVYANSKTNFTTRYSSNIEKLKKGKCLIRPSEDLDEIINVYEEIEKQLKIIELGLSPENFNYTRLEDLLKIVKDENSFSEFGNLVVVCKTQEQAKEILYENRYYSELLMGDYNTRFLVLTENETFPGSILMRENFNLNPKQKRQL